MTGKASATLPVGVEAFRESVREFAAFVESERSAYNSPASRVLVGAIFYIVGIGVGAALLVLLLRLVP